MNKTFLLLIIFLVIGGITYFLTQKEDKKTTVLTEHRNFAVPNIEDVAKIFMADRNGRAITLEKKATHWQVNGKWKANPSSMSHLLNTIQKVKIKYVPPRAAVKNIINDIATNNIKIEIYHQNGEQLKTYYVGGVTNDELGTHMIMEGAEAPFVTYLPGFEGTLRVRYILEETDWRDKSIFTESIQTIQSVSVAYPKQKSKSFKIERAGKKWKLAPFYNTTPKLKQVAPQGVIESYLVGFERLLAEGFENENELRDSVVQQVPFAIIHLTKIDGTEKIVKLHPIIKKTKKGEIILTEAGIPLIEKYFAEVGGVDFMLTQQLVFKKILWAYRSFFE